MGLLHKGERIGVVGRNGSGKSTLAKILVNMYPHYKGNIFYNNIDMKKISLNLIRKKVPL